MNERMKIKVKEVTQKRNVECQQHQTTDRRLAVFAYSRKRKFRSASCRSRRRPLRGWAESESARFLSSQRLALRWRRCVDLALQDVVRHRGVGVPRLVIHCDGCAPRGLGSLVRRHSGWITLIMRAQRRSTFAMRAGSRSRVDWGVESWDGERCAWLAWAAAQIATSLTQLTLTRSGGYLSAP